MPSSSVTEQPQSETLNDIVSRIVLRHNMVEEEQLDDALVLQREILDTEGKKESLERVLLDMGILRGKQLKGLRYAIIYYLVRKADRFYGKIAIQSDICEQKWVNAALREQKRIHVKEHRLVRMNKILLEKGYINSRENRAILRAIEGIRERRRKVREGGKKGKKGRTKARKGKAKRVSESADSELDLDDELDALGPLDALSDCDIDEGVGATKDDPQSIEELEALSGIGEALDDIDVDDIHEVGDEEELDTNSSVGELDDDLGPSDEDLDADLDDDDETLSDLDDDEEDAGTLSDLNDEDSAADDISDESGTLSDIDGDDELEDSSDDELGDELGDDSADLDDDDDDEASAEASADLDDDDEEDEDSDDDEDSADDESGEVKELEDSDDDGDGDGDEPAADAGKKGGFFSRMLSRKKAAPGPKKPRKKIGAAKTSGKAGKTSAKTGKASGKAKAIDKGKKSAKAGKKTGKKIDTSKMKEMAKKRRAKRFGR